MTRAGIVVKTVLCVLGLELLLYAGWHYFSYKEFPFGAAVVVGGQYPDGRTIDPFDCPVSVQQVGKDLYRLMVTDGQNTKFRLELQVEQDDSFSDWRTTGGGVSVHLPLRDSDPFPLNFKKNAK